MIVNFKTFLSEASGDKEAYQKFFNSMLKKFGVKSASELDDKKKKEFYDAIDAGWEADKETDEAVVVDGRTKGYKEAVARLAARLAKKEDCGDHDDDDDDELEEGKFSAALIKKALKIAKNSTGDYDHAWEAIEKLKKGLADLDIVAKALKTANEDKND